MAKVFQEGVDEVLVHMVVPSDDGVIRTGSEWAKRWAGVQGPPGGQRYALLCGATIDEYHRASGEPWATNCPKCVEALHEAGVSTELPTRGSPGAGKKPAG